MEGKGFFDMMPANLLHGLAGVKVENEEDIEMEKKALAEIDKLTKELEHEEFTISYPQSREDNSYSQSSLRGTPEPRPKTTVSQKPTDLPPSRGYDSNEPIPTISTRISRRRTINESNTPKEESFTDDSQLKRATSAYPEESSIQALNTRSSRRKRTIGSDRPVTAPSLKPALKKPQDQRLATPMSEGFRPNTQEDHKTVTIQEPPQLSPEEMKLKLLETQLNNALTYREKAFAEARQRFDNMIKLEVEKQEKDHEKDLEQLKDWFESKRNALEGTRRQQEKIASLMQTLSKHSQTINSMSKEFSRDSKYSEELKEQELLSKEKGLEQRQVRLTTEAQLIEQDKQRLDSRKALLEQVEAQRREMLRQENSLLEKERIKLQDLQNFFKQVQRERASDLAVQEHKLSLENEEHQTNQATLTQDLQEQQNNLTQRISDSETKRQETLASLNYEKNTVFQQLAYFSDFKRNLTSMNAELEKRNKTVQEKLKEIVHEEESLRKMKTQLEKEKAQFDQEAEKVHSLSLELNEQAEAITAARSQIETQKNQLEEQRQRAYAMLNSARKQKTQAEIQKQQLQTRLQTYQQVKHSKPLPEVEIPEVPSIHDIPKPQRSRSVVPVAQRFKASNYLRELETYTFAQANLQTYLNSESEQLLSSKLAYETGFTKSFLSGKPSERSSFYISNPPNFDSEFKPMSTSFSIGSKL